MNLLINGQPRAFDALPDACSVTELLAALNMQADRVALELNGIIVARSGWADSLVHEGDRLEIVHFVGGGSPASR